MLSSANPVDESVAGRRKRPTRSLWATVRFWLISVSRVIVPLALLAWIVWQALREDPDHPDALRTLFAQPKDVRWLSLSVVAYLGAIWITFGRWFILVRALRLPFRFRDATRLGFVGYFLQFLSFGAVGGDLFKALFVAREQPERKPEAVATIFIDRAVGMLALLILTCLAFVWLGWGGLSGQLHAAAIACFVTTAVGLFVVAGLLWTRATTRPLRARLRRFPRVCAALLRVEHALLLYRTHRTWFVIALCSGLISHTGLALSAFFAAQAVFPDAPTYGEQLVIWNISGAVATLPLSPGGLGTFEAAYSYLYQIVPQGGRELSDGFAVALLLRLVSIVVAGIGVVVYWLCRREIKQLLNQASGAESS